MRIIDETLGLRQELTELAASPDWDLLTRHDLLARKPPATLQDRFFRLARKLLAATGLCPPHVTHYEWQPTLKHVPLEADVMTLLIWAPGVERDELRDACRGFAKRLEGNTSLAPVLVTDVADFAFFSRLGWLLEYLPALSGEGQSFRERKKRYLAWRYRDALVVPASAGWVEEPVWGAILEASIGG